MLQISDMKRHVLCQTNSLLKRGLSFSLCDCKKPNVVASDQKIGLISHNAPKKIKHQNGKILCNKIESSNK